MTAVRSSNNSSDYELTQWSTMMVGSSFGSSGGSSDGYDGAPPSAAPSAVPPSRGMGTWLLDVQ